MECTRGTSRGSSLPGVGIYVAFLRGINLGPTNKISMPELRQLAEELGYTDVATYINSGNLIFGSTKKPDTLERELSAAIAKRFGSSIDVAVRTPKQLREIVDGNPYPEGNPSQVAVAFLTKEAPAGAKKKVAEFATEAEPFTFAGSEVYVNYTNGMGRSKLAEKFSSIVGVSSTVRNVRTVAKVLELAERT
jgi:uncharacterized protein (DUF1697 family)